MVMTVGYTNRKSRGRPVPVVVGIINFGLSFYIRYQRESQNQTGIREVENTTGLVLTLMCYVNISRMLNEAINTR